MPLPPASSFLLIAFWTFVPRVDQSGATVMGAVEVGFASDTVDRGLCHRLDEPLFAVDDVDGSVRICEHIP